MSKNKSESNILGKKRAWLIVLAIFLFLILIFVGLIAWFENSYAQKFYPGVKIGYLDISGQTKDQVSDQLKGIEDNLQNKGLIFIAEDKEISVHPIIISADDPDLAKPILFFNWQETLDKAYAVGRGGKWYENLLKQFQIFFASSEILVTYQLNTPELVDTLKANFSELETLPVDARLEISDNKPVIIDEISGLVFNYQKAVSNLVENIKNLNFSPIYLSLMAQEPAVKKENTGSVMNSLDKVLDIESFKITFEPNWWRISKEQFIGWLELQSVEDEVVIGLNKEKVLEFLQPITELINVEAQDAKFELSGNRVTKFQASRDGKLLDMEESYKIINNQVIIGEASDIELAVVVDKSKVATNDVNDLGIKELIGRGTSNFAGSPPNRRHNIATGAAALNGILIKPGEDFSLLDALGDIDGKNGYKQELVIKGDRTIPEYGGGLCQIGTTVFRVALRSGLPITMRRNHSYRVSYYEPAGMDATIYNPSPDMKFLNDTGYHILFTTYIDGDELIFEFYGTADGRKVLIDPDPPSIFNISSPGAPRYIETENLAPGEKKIVEHSHRGADTYFKYTVTYPDDKVVETDFNSHYVAWPEVWLVGKEPEISTTTDEVVDGSLISN